MQSGEGSCFLASSCLAPQFQDGVAEALLVAMVCSRTVPWKLGRGWVLQPSQWVCKHFKLSFAKPTTINSVVCLCAHFDGTYTKIGTISLFLNYDVVQRLYLSWGCCGADFQSGIWCFQWHLTVASSGVEVVRRPQQCLGWMVLATIGIL